MIRRLIATLGCVTLALSAAALSSAQASGADGSDFVTRVGANLRLDGKPFKFAGSNNYYLMYKSPLMVDDVFADAAAAGRLDYVLYAAGQAGIKLVIPLTNNWRDFGGMDQYVRWRGGQFHDDFYTDPVIRNWY